MAGNDQNQMSRVNRNKETPKTGKKNNNKNKKKKGKRIGWILFFTVVIAIFCALAGYLFIMISGEKLLKENQDKLTANGTSKVYDRNGKLMGELSIQKSEPVKYEDIPELVKQAFVATEDKRFWEHSGVDIWSIGRAVVKDVMARSMVEGGSTITQQLAKNIFLTRDKTFFRKATEVSIALALERNHKKEEILTMYLNRINFGGPYYGIKAASKRYFGKDDLKDLKLWEVATLAAMPKGPSKYNPLRNPEESMKRRAVVLNLMRDQGIITAEEAEEAKKVEYTYKPPANTQERKYTAFIDYVLDEAEAKWGMTEDDLNIGGYHIYTTMDVNAQKAVEDEFNNPANFERGVGEEIIQGSMVIMNQHTGGIVAMAGGRDYQRGGYNRAVASRRQPGSALKPIAAYAPALETGDYHQNSRLSNKKQCFGTYCPNNLHGYSETVSMQQAIQTSENIAAVWTLNQIGVKNGYEFVKKMGIPAIEEDKNLTLALGGMTKGTNTFEMTRAYSAFANGGELKEAFAIKEIKDSRGKVIHENKGGGDRVMKPETASEMTKMMETVVQSGTGRNAKISRPVAGKTGTTQSGYKGVGGVKDIWFAGYTPELTATVWMGYDTPNRDRLMRQSSPMAAALWGKVMEKAVQGYKAGTFPMTEVPVPEPEETPEMTAVRNLTGSYDPQTQRVSLSWTGVDGEGIVYRVYRKEASEAEYTRIQDSLGDTSAEDPGVMEGLTYSYYVTAYDPAQDAESEPSNILQVVAAGAALPEEPEEEPEEEVPPPEQGTPGENNGQPGQGNGQGGQNPPGEGQGGQTPGSGQGGGQGTGNGSGGGSGGGSGQEPGTGSPGTGSGQGGNPGGGQGGGQGGNQGGGGTTPPGTVQPPTNGGTAPVPPPEGEGD